MAQRRFFWAYAAAADPAPTAMRAQAALNQVAKPTCSRMESHDRQMTSGCQKERNDSPLESAGVCSVDLWEEAALLYGPAFRFCEWTSIESTLPCSGRCLFWCSPWAKGANWPVSCHHLTTQRSEILVSERSKRKMKSIQW